MAYTAATRNWNGPTTKLYPENCQLGSGLLCGEDLAAGDACYIKLSDNLVYKAGGSGVVAFTDEAAHVHGFAAQAAKYNGGLGRNEAVTLLIDIDVTYDTAGGIRPGQMYYLSHVSATKGLIAWDTVGVAAPIAGQRPVAIGVSSTRVRLLNPAY